MTKRVGVLSIWDAYRNFDRLKRDALLFDSIAIWESSSPLPWGHWLSDEDNAVIRADMDWLLAHEIVVDPDPTENTLDEEVAAIAAVHSARREYKHKNDAIEMVRYWTTIFNSRPNTSACWLLPSLPPLPSGEPKRTDVLRLVLNAFPTPTADVSWERIEEFRLNHDSRVKRSRLIGWINDMGRTTIPEIEICDKLEALLNDYSEHMRIHEIKVSRGALETVVVTAAELAEDLLKFKWGKLAKGLFELTHERIQLREAELKAPGRELAYIDAAKRAFTR